LTISTSGKSPRGTYSIKITGMNGSLTHSITASLTIT
jgi:hypothetical protein